MRASDVLAVAAKELGYCEKKTNSELSSFTANAGQGNYTKYAVALYEAGYYNGNKNGFAWCDVFVDWCFYVAAGYDGEEAQRIECQTGDLGAGTEFSAQYYKAQGRFDTTPRVGDQIFFYVGGGIGHTGLVESVTGTSVTTIEGNSGDKVQRHSYTRGALTIAGYGHPKYEAGEAAEAPAQSSAADYDGLPTVRRGDAGAAVKVMQYALLYAGETLPRYGADGECGSETVTAIRSFQRKAGLFPDGVCGEKTWRAILEGICA